MLTLKAPAKINLTLEVLSRRHDGYHEIISILQTVSLFDRLTLEPSSSLRLECNLPQLESEENLALRAAKLLREEAGTSQGAMIKLEKSIPAGAGLGGGSSDAASAIKGLNKLWGLGLSTEDLLPLASRLGSDVPFFLYGGTALVQGRGEKVRPLPAANLAWFVLLKPPIHIPRKTATLYSMLSPANFTRGLLTHKLAGRIRGGGDVPSQFLFNVFDDVAIQAFPGLKECWDTIRSLDAREIHLAGSGPCLFAPVAKRELGTAIQLLLERRYGWESYLVSPWDPSKESEVG